MNQSHHSIDIVSFYGSLCILQGKLVPHILILLSCLSKMAYPFLLGTPTSHPGMKKKKNHQHKAMFGFSEAEGKERIGEKGKQIHCLVEMNRGKGKEN